MARIAWAVLTKGEVYRPPLMASGELVCNWRLAKDARLGNRIRDSHNRRPAATTAHWLWFPVRFAGEQWAGKTVEPGALETWYSSKSSETV